MKADRDPEQQRLIGAILTMAERLELETLAEGVETVGEHALLAQLGCDHVQGFGIARPMPFDQTVAQLHRRRATVARQQGFIVVGRLRFVLALLLAVASPGDSHAAHPSASSSTQEHVRRDEESRSEGLL